MKKNKGIVIIGGLLLLGVGLYFIFRKPKKKIEDKKIGESKILKDAYDNLVFETNKDVIKPVSFPFLDEVANVLREAPTWTLNLEGHTDNVGSDSYNLDLSQKRADAVKKYLVEQGISENRITAKGFGESKPIADNSTPEGREKNRRVEFKIVKTNIQSILV
jgi:outer membrane protein OmpA-like peptidoglycan-associated protein